MAGLPNTPGRKAAQARYNKKPEQKKRRAQRNKTRRKLIREGRVRVGDGKDIDHKNHDTSNMSSKNLQVQPANVNRRDGGPSARMVYHLLKPKSTKRSAVSAAKKRKKK